MRTLAGIALLALTSWAQAAYIQCTPAQADTVINAVGATATFTCNPGTGIDAGGADDNVVGDGWTIESVSLRLSGTFQENAGPAGQSYSVLYSGLENSTQFAIAAISCTASGTASAQNQALGNCVSTSSAAGVAGNLDALSSFTVTVTGGAGSNPLPFNASSSVFYQVNAIRPTVSVPEPGALALLASSFIGLALLRRRRR